MNDSRGMLGYAALTRPTFFAYVDWDKRDSVKAAMPNAARVVLRRLGCPITCIASGHCRRTMRILRRGGGW